MTSSAYSSLMQSLNPREGTEMSERLQKLQELEKLRRERELTRQMRRQQSGDPVVIRSSRLGSADKDSENSGYSYGVRRGLSRSNSENEQYGGYYSSLGDYGARPKNSGYSGGSYGQPKTEQEELSDMISDITSQVLGQSKHPNISGPSTFSSYSSSVGNRPRLGNYRSSSFQSSDHTQGYEPPSYLRSFDEYKSGGTNLDDEEYQQRVEKRAARALARQQRMAGNTGGEEQQETEYIEYTQNDEEGQDTNETAETHEDINHDYEEGEEPKHFIERLKNGSPAQSKRSVGNGYGVHNIPSIPPLKKQRPDGSVEILDDDILAVAKDIRATFGIKSPKSGDSQASERQFDFSSNKENLADNSGTSGDFVFTATRDTRQSRSSAGKRRTRRSLRGSKENLDNDRNSLHTNVSESNENAEESVLHEIYTVEDVDDDVKKCLPMSDDFDKSIWLSGGGDMTPGKVNTMHEYFTGQTADDEPVIKRVLDGRGVKDDLERSFSSDNKRSVSSSVSTPRRVLETSSKKTGKKGQGATTPISSKKSPGKHKSVQKVKGINKSSDSDNDFFQTASESESDFRNSRRSSGASTPTKNVTDTPKNGSKARQDIGLTLGDKLTKLETMTQEKKRKQSATESESKRDVPSYMSGTSASQNKSRAKSPAGLAKDVRELKKFVHEHTSETKTPVHLSRKDVLTGVHIPPKTVIVKEMSTQTDEKFNNSVSPVYVCIHCGKCSDQRVESAVSDAGTTDGEDTESLDRYETRSETGYRLRSKKLNKPSTTKWTFGKNENRRTPTGTKSYMKGTTSSSLKNNVADNNENVRKTSVPDIQNEVSKLGKSKSMVAQRAKELENAAKKGEQKRMAFSRSSSTERKKNNKFTNERSKLGKSKSVETMYMVKSKPQYVVDIDTEVSEKDVNSNVINKDSVHKELNSTMPASPRSQTQHSPVRENQPLPKDEPFTSPKLKPPAVAPKPKRPAVSDKTSTPASPTKSDEVFDAAVESKGQFTRLEHNPFIRNDAHRRNSLKDRKDGESVWEKSESRSTSAGSPSPQRESALNRSLSSAGEKSSLTNLNWSDSGSSESMHASKSSRTETSHRGSKSSLHGSFESLPQSPPRQRSSSTSSNTMLNLLSPIGTVRNPVTGDLETDVDAAYDQAEDNNNNNSKPKIPDTVEHNEETVDRAHLEFAKQALDILEFESKTRDSSSDSQKGSKMQGKAISNGLGKGGQVNDQENKGQANGQTNNADDKGSKKNKGRKGFFKGKFRK